MNHTPMDKWKRYERFYTASVKDHLGPEEIQKTVKSLYEEEGFGNVYKETLKKKMLPYVAKMLCVYNIDMANWEPIYNNYKERNSHIVKELDRIYSALYEDGIKKVFVTENFGALLSSGRDIALFTSGDVDNYADISEKEKIYEVFDKLGYSRKERYTSHLLSSTTFYNASLFNDDFHFGMSWEPLSRLKLPTFIKADDFVDWNALREVKGTSIKLAPIEALTYICLMHITLHSICRAPAIRLFADVLNCTSGETKPNWNVIEKWAKRDKTMTRFITTAYLSKSLAGADIPDTIIKQVDYRRVQDLLSLTYDKECGCLRPEPSSFEVLKIELACCDKGRLCGLMEMLFPNKEWLKTTYGHGVLLSNLIHFVKIM